MKFCPQCGTTLIPGDRFCQECGFDISLIQDQAEPVAEETKPQPEPVQAPVAGQFCPQCGKPLIAGDRFCQECGFDTQHPVTAKVETAQPSSPPPVVPPLPQPAPVRKKGKSLLWVLIILGIAALGAGGWYGYNKFLKPADNEAVAADTTTQEQPVVTIDTTVTVTEEDTVIETEEPLVAPTETKQVVEKKKEKQPAKTQAKPSARATKPAQTATQQQTTPASPKPVITITPAESGTTGKATAVFTVGAKDNPKNMHPKNPTKCTLNRETTITRIITDHYNGGKGDPTGGTITMKDKGGNVIGQWRATPAANKNGVPGAKWICNINVNVKPGTYFIQDSNPSTWSKNALSVGFVEIIGIEK